MAAGVVKLSSKEQNSEDLNLAGCQINNTPGLFAESEMQQYRQQDKTSLRKCIEKRYKDAFYIPTSTLSACVLVKDGMQDIFLSPLKNHITFKD